MLKKLLTKLLTSNFPLFTSQRGMSSIYIIIFIIMTAFAITLAGGGNSLFTGNTGSFITPTITPDPAAPSSTIPSITSTVGLWNIDHSLSTCTKETPSFITAKFAVTGIEDGYIQLSIDSPYKIVTTQAFIKPSQDFTFTLSAADGFGASSWKFEVFSGGTKTGTNWTGGTLQKTYNGSPTGCL